MDQEPWAYEASKIGNLFKLAWKDDEGNASKPQREDLILLRRVYVTHLVEILDEKPGREKWQGDFTIYRIVEVLWVIDWKNPPSSAKADEVFGYSVKGYQGGDVMFLETMPTFQQHWQNQGGLTEFQARVRSLLNLPESSDNG